MADLFNLVRGDHPIWFHLAAVKRVERAYGAAYMGSNDKAEILRMAKDVVTEACANIAALQLEIEQAEAE